MPFKNFSIWRGRLPHWRADGVLYYVTFRHRRPLEDKEQVALFQSLFRRGANQRELLALVVMPEYSEMIFSMRENLDGKAKEFSKFVEQAKNATAKRIMKSTGERYSPFYFESFDRIVRDESELGEKLQAMTEAPYLAGLVEEGRDFATMYVEGA